MYADTSFLFSLYGNDNHTSRAITLMKNRRSPLIVTPLNEYELGNALRFAEYREVLAPGEAELFWGQFEEDREAGRVIIQVSNLAEILNEARRLSVTYTLKGGHRGFDILHVAAALVLKGKEFLTFDSNQKKLAKAEGLRVP